MLGLRLRFALVCVVGCVLGALLSSCSLFKTTCAEDDRECLGPGEGLGAGLGGACTITADCKQNLTCQGGRCTTTGAVERCTYSSGSKSGQECDDAQCFAQCERCRLTLDCSEDDYCGSRRVCLLAGSRGEGAECLDTGDCRRGLVCELPDLTATGVLSLNDLANLAGTCKRGGNGEQGDPCDVISDCLAGLYCAEIGLGTSEKVCTNLPQPIPLPDRGNFELPPTPDIWTGVSDCPAPAADDTKLAVFDVPRASTDFGDDFYSLPFPNDIRRRDDGTLDLGGMALPPEDIGVPPLINRFTEVAGEDLRGFSTNAVAVLRFSHAYDFRTVAASSVRLVDITQGSPDYNMERGTAWKTTRGPLSNYVCPHWLGIARPLGSPLRPGTTYAAIVTTDVKVRDPEEGSRAPVASLDDFERAPDFEAMLASARPSDSVLANAWERYAPLRAWIGDTNQNASRILIATVFTTQDPRATIRGLRERIVEDGPATLSEITDCSRAGATSPCQTIEEDDDGNRETRGACQNTSGDDFTEIHARIRLPIFQKGTRPYLSPDDGGAIELDSEGLPVIQEHEDVCIAISVPNAAPPSGGYPVLVYSHGTGGAFTNPMTAGARLARDLATSPTPAVVVAIDLPQHGERRGSSEDSMQDPDGLFYNFLNPRAARDNVAQGSADLFSVVQWVAESGGLSMAESPTGAAVPFDDSRIVLMGHSQGATHTALMISHEPRASAVVLSGVGAHLTSSLLTKTSPVDIARVVPFGLHDPDGDQLAAGIFNPALSVIQAVFDAADPINYARLLRLERVEDVPTGHHAFVTYGVGDTFSPEVTQATYAVAGQLPLVTPVLRVPNQVSSDLESATVPTVAPPYGGMDSIGGTPRVIAMRQYEPMTTQTNDEGEDEVIDGHFVAVVPGERGRAEVLRFLRATLSGQAPSIGEQ